MASKARENASILDYKNEAELGRALTASLTISDSESNKLKKEDWQLPCPCTSLSVENEVKRLAVLSSFRVLETDKEDAFDSLTEELRKSLNVPWACLSLVDLGRQWFKSFAEADDAVLNITETPRRDAFCSHTIMNEKPLIIPDAMKDERFKENRSVTGAPRFRFYAGAPLVSSEGYKIGALCVLDKQPHPEGLSPAKQQELQSKADSVMKLLINRRNSLRCLRKRGSDENLARTEKESASRQQAEGNLKRSRASSTSSSSEVIPRPRIELFKFPSPDTAIDPDAYLLQLVETMHPDVKITVKPALDLNDFFPMITEEQMAAYSMKVVNLARANDVDALRTFRQEEGRAALDCFNRFGEGLLNMACRRGFKEMAEFLLSPEVDLSVRVRDDYGRTPLHDACWNPEPQLEICKWILQKDPSLFLVADKRGFTPFQYARKSDWPVWRQFLFDNKEHLHAFSLPEISKRFHR